MENFDTDIAALAKSVATKAQLPDTPLPDSVEALKVLTQYYALRLKHKPEDGDENDTFGGISGRLKEIDTQEKQDGAANASRIRSRPRRSDA